MFVLDGFLKVTNMFQGDGVSISRVYPSVLYLKKLLTTTTFTNSSKIITPISFISEFMSKCLSSLNSRFDTLFLFKTKNIVRSLYILRIFITINQILT